MHVIIPYPGSTPEEVEATRRGPSRRRSRRCGHRGAALALEAEQATFQIQFDWGRDIDAAAFQPDAPSWIRSARSLPAPTASRVLVQRVRPAGRRRRSSDDQDLMDQPRLAGRYMKRAAGTPFRRRSRRSRKASAPREVLILIGQRMAAHSSDRAAARHAPAEEQFSVSAGEITEQDSASASAHDR